ncbi:alkaline phosphatase family protein [Piscinibacter defluvii]|uniref:alkaline phosphatase family protein n=1 Tax=Piscinibacter defluvii TaxID=1796922 RepID=UPI000FDD4CA7|nr:alkaline phosphatase family protein [Piscinibacter defluvii]
MTYPTQIRGQVLGLEQVVNLTFRPAAAGLVNVVVVAVGLQPDTGEGGGGKQQPKAVRFASYSVALRVEILKPGATVAVATKTRLLNISAPDQPTRLVITAHATAGAAELAGDWTMRLTNTQAGSPKAAFPLAPARCDATVRYPTMPGNLGKVDHVVVLMMENRSFDHMLGYLSLPTPTGAGRADVDGLKGTEYNLDSSHVAQTVHHRTSTRFHNDPGHGHEDVVEQLAGDTATNKAVALPGPLKSNAGFVRNFERQLAREATDPNLPPRWQQVHDTATVDAGDTRAVAFRPTLPGLISARCVVSNAPRKTESGLLGSIEIWSPGATHPVASISSAAGNTTLAVAYPAAAAELAPAGNWTCRVSSGADKALAFDTTITFVQEPHDTSHFERPSEVMSYYNAADLPAYDALAAQFTVCDRWFASVPTDTWPNRIFAMTGQTGGLLETPSGSSAASQPPSITAKTIFEVLSEHGVDWRVFFSDMPFALIYERLAQDANYTARMRPIAEFLDRASTGDLPSFTWVDPNFSDVPDGPRAASDDHPPDGDINNGQVFVARVYNALIQSPAWPKTVLIITYDEHGGFYDHVKPLLGFGPRVPCIVVSPWSSKGTSKVVFDHTSILSTVLHRFCAGAAGQVPDMGTRAGSAHSLASVLSASAPNLQPTGVEVAPSTRPDEVRVPRDSAAAALRHLLFGF